MSNVFDVCIFHVFKAEGGFSNRANDRGGPTNFGITAKTLATYRGVALCSAEDVQNLSRQEAATIYRQLFWNVAKLDRVQSWKVALCVFDHAVHSGPLEGVKTLQRALNIEASGASISIDGVMGNETDGALSRANEAALLKALIRERQLFLAAVCQRFPEQTEFLKGWLARTHKLADTVGAAP